MPTHREWIAVLAASHDRLAGLATRFDSDGVRGPSYCDHPAGHREGAAESWTIAQVFSHIGSGAESGLNRIDAALGGTTLPVYEDLVPIWQRWDAMSPDEMVANAVESDGRYVRRLEALDDATLDAFHRPPYGGQHELTISDVVALRLNEHATHVWDIEVMLDPAAVVQQGAIEVLMDRLRLASLARGVKRWEGDTTLAIATSDPDTCFLLAIHAPREVDVLPAGTVPSDGELVLSAEALFRLQLGRLDGAHMPVGTKLSGPVSFDDLRALYPGL